LNYFYPHRVQIGREREKIFSLRIPFLPDPG